MNRSLLVILLSFLALFGCNSSEEGQSITNAMSLSGADRIYANLAPKGDLNSRDVRKVEFHDQKEIEKWIGALSRVPFKGPGKMIKMRGDAREFTIEFHKGKKTVATLRIKGGLLDSPQAEGWDFYDGEDASFVQLVEGKFEK